MMGETVKITPGIGHAGAGAARTSDRVSLENYAKVGILVTQFQAAGGTANITVDKHTAATGGTESTGMTLNNFWKMEDITVGTTADTWTKGTAAATIATSNTAGNLTSYYWIEIDADEVRTVNSTVDYKFIEVEISNGGQATNFLYVTFFLFGPRYAGNTLPSAQA
jgi:hypothetical protein